MGEVTNFNDHQVMTARRELRHEVRYPPFDQVAADGILDALRQGMTLATVKSLASTPRWGTVRVWMETVPEFAQAYRDAMRDQAEYFLNRGDGVASDVDREPSCRKVELDWIRDRIKWAAPDVYGRNSEGPTQTVNVAIQNNVTMDPAEAYQALLKGNG